MKTIKKIEIKKLSERVYINDLKRVIYEYGRCIRDLPQNVFTFANIINQLVEKNRQML